MNTTPGRHGADDGRRSYLRMTFSDGVSASM